MQFTLFKNLLILLTAVSFKFQRQFDLLTSSVSINEINCQRKYNFWQISADVPQMLMIKPSGHRSPLIQSQLKTVRAYNIIESFLLSKPWLLHAVITYNHLVNVILCWYNSVPYYRYQDFYWFIYSLIRSICRD